MSGGWTALLLAGSRPGSEGWTEEFGSDLKPLIAIAGAPMIRRPLAALLACPEIAAVRILGQEPGRIAAALEPHARVSVERSGATIAETLLGILEDPATRFPLLVTTADHALLDPAMIGELMAGAAGSDVAVGLVSETNMLRRFPGTRRTWLRLGPERYSGANLFALSSARSAEAIRGWRAIEQERKKGLRLLRQLGIPLFLAAVLRLRDVHQTAAALGSKLGIRLRAVELSDPAAAIDVDKPADHALVTAILGTGA